jgi:cytochrome c556
MKLAIAMAFVAAAATPLTSYAQFKNAEAAVKYRQGALTVMSSHFASIGAVVKGEKPYDKLSVEQDAAVIETLAKLPWHAFTPNSATPASKAKPEVWSEAEKFKAGAEKLQVETGKLNTAARSGDLAAIKASFGATAETCKSCHDNFRNK